MALNPDVYTRNFYALAGYGFVAIVFCFFPLAGFLADVKYGRYKMVVRSLCLIFPSVLLLAVSIGVCWFTLQSDCFHYHSCDVVTLFC